MPVRHRRATTIFLPVRGSEVRKKSSKSLVKTRRMSISLRPGVAKRVSLAAAKREVTIDKYLLGALEERLREDLTGGCEGTISMTAKTDPVLAELWDNPKDARYDSLRSSVKLNPSRRQTFGARGGT